ncbi:NACHT, LRR and PYD domains-containing protein 9-like [Pygocentrus nattereri]|uniref:NACHT, LRR and PYD domains-containing protein 9-like n=1 Tax=Pygocentrus nattereri TaxID=42514 RepID=UPI00081427F8|nr:NACHT, LRR and PYD domains-containing protein 9-like [Pygocentrus nattereri]
MGFVRTDFVDPYQAKVNQSSGLRHCSITEKGCKALVKTLKLNPSHLRKLELDFNEPGESGVKMLSALLEDPHYKLEKLDI